MAIRPKLIYGIIFLKLSKQRPLISVVVTTHQRPNLLGRALHSLTSQEFADFEIILCSDSSDVATADVAFQFLRPTDTFLVAPGRAGPAETRNLGLQLCRGEWTCFLDDDDTFDAKYFSNIVSRLAGAKIHYVNYSRISEQRGGEKGLFLRDKAYIDISAVPPEKLFIQNFIPNNSIFLPTLIATTCSFDMQLKSHEDWDWLINLKSRGYDFNFVELSCGPNVHIDFSEVTRNKSPSTPLDYLSIYRKWPALDELIREARAQKLASMGISIEAKFL